MSSKKRISVLYISGIVVVVIVLVVAIYATKPAKPMVESVRNPRVPVRTIDLETSSIRRTITLLGTARARSRAQSAAEVGGNVVWISENCEPGRKVARGEALVRIDPRPYAIALDQAEASYAEAEAAVGLQEITNQTEEAKLEESKDELDAAQNELERKERLFKKGVISASELDTQRSSFSTVKKTYLDVLSNVNSAKALLRQKEAQLAMNKAQRDKAALDLERTTLCAPFDGEIANRSVDVGNHISANTVAFEAVDFSTVVVDIQVPSRYLGVVREDVDSGVCSDVLVTVNARDGRISRRGRLAHLSPSAESDTRLFAAEIYVDNPADLSPILPGQFVEAVIQKTTPERAVVIPYAAMTQDSSGLYVYTVEQAAAAGGQPASADAEAANQTAAGAAPVVEKARHARKIYVDVAWEQGENAVIQGLEPGTTLVVSGQEDLVDGAPVDIVGTGMSIAADYPDGAVSAAAGDNATACAVSAGE
ncbi:efflux RND transporter periplasmic adaptor subunit [Oceanidesulfovibrio marinus]|uniref:Efflux RND transporter periplasmic adaptor subunit n=1 Tax=Oceanidesulfovibrio marinus TaxID=370038 RepID=A0ABX6NIY1_9BACT|nr:efflux RND transporter periplasmic adaptor subunit [Oceanidesulfovibrio marinus]QJT10543.1 efflux RND transporter periplasmic adaptor subunit [Oceanidesulfovibrio marinus]